MSEGGQFLLSLDNPTFTESDVTVGPAVTVVGPRVGAMGDRSELSLHPVKMSATATPTADPIISGNITQPLENSDCSGCRYSCRRWE